MSAKFVIGAASAVSGIVIVVCLASMAMMFQDINSLYDELMGDMAEFRTLNADSWRGMMAMQGVPGVSKPKPDEMATIFGRNKPCCTDASLQTDFSFRVVDMALNGASFKSSKRQPCGPLRATSAEKFKAGSGKPAANDREKLDASSYPAITLPPIRDGDRFVEFNICRGSAQLKRDIVHAATIAERKLTIEDDSKPINGRYHLRLYPEQYRIVEFASPAEQPIQVYLHNILGKWFVYKVYQRVSVQHRFDRFMSKVHYLGSIPADVLAELSYTEICDRLSILEILSHDEDRKAELRLGRSNGARLSMRSARGHRLANESSFSAARDRVKAPNLLKIHVSKQMNEIVQYAQDKIALLDSEARKDSLSMVKKIQAYLNSNDKRIVKLPSRPDYLNIQRRLNALIPKDRTHAEELLYLKDVTLADLANGLLDLPCWAEHHYLFMRAKKSMKVVWKYGEIAVYDPEKKKRRMLRVQNSSYSHRVQPVKAISDADVFDGPKLKMTCFKPPPKPPSVDSESGMSTVFSMSTATTSPNSWEYHPWDMQPGKDELTFRIEDDSLHNPKTIRAKAMKAMSERLIGEINRRVELLTQDFSDFQRIKSPASLEEDTFTEVADSNGQPIPLEPLGNCKWLRRCEKEIRQILACPKPSTEQKKDLQVLMYAKERYEPILSQYDKRQKVASNTAGSKLGFNETLKNLVEADIVSSDSASALMHLVGDEQSWIIDSHYSNLMLVERCDLQPKPPASHILKNFLTTNENRAIFFVFIFIFLAILVGFGLVLAALFGVY
ncbi:hypothetical protein QR680_010994 [Steinernema hermaphroditum]|uniref:Nematode cuticle collagen N-terminal domain-containing protein n=1 Tax=Steinernema hermaphroditum TaxID=289476 RepID=A0AA39ITJ7_9BILA|nr:hypothetical protein QR680_010994 [Steinernema hermaphroditum]